MAGRAGAAADEGFARAVREQLFPALAEGVRLFLEEAASDDSAPSIARICRDHGHTPEDARLWLQSVRCTALTPRPAPSHVGLRYALGDSPEQPFSVDAAQMQRSLAALEEVGLVPPDLSLSDLLGRDNLVATVQSSDP